MTNWDRARDYLLKFHTNLSKLTDFFVSTLFYYNVRSVGLYKDLMPDIERVAWGWGLMVKITTLRSSVSFKPD